jgi:hypothetical protein
LVINLRVKREGGCRWISAQAELFWTKINFKRQFIADYPQNAAVFSIMVLKN